MTTSTDERRARAMCRRIFDQSSPECDITAFVDRYWKNYLPEAVACRIDDEAAGMVLVPREFSVDAYKRFVGRDRLMNMDRPGYENAKEQYGTMIAAATEVDNG